MSWDDYRCCSVEGCQRSVRSKGWCNKHYLKYYRKAEDYKQIVFGENLRNHPFYIIWWQRKNDNVLSDEWKNDLRRFINDISPKPEGNYFLVRIRNEPFGPNNFKWQEHLKRKEGETRKDWWARKRAARIAANPSMESDRNINRRYGISRAQYDELLKLQNDGCAICGQRETSFDPRAGTVKKLAVDHCHKTNKIRGLLCWRCNGTIGKLEDDIELLDKMRAYLVKHG